MRPGSNGYVAYRIVGYVWKVGTAVAALAGLAVFIMELAQDLPEQRQPPRSVNEQMTDWIPRCLNVGAAAVAVSVAAFFLWLAISILSTNKPKVNVGHAVDSMTTDELTEAIAALGATYLRLQQDGQHEKAQQVAADRALCQDMLVERTSRPAKRGSV